MKIKLAGIKPATPEARRGLIQDTKPKETGTKKQTQNRLEQEADYIGQGKPIRPTGADSKLSLSMKKKLAKIKQARTAHDHGHTILMKGHTRGIYKSASLDTQMGKYAKYWLLNAKQTNGNGWGIAAKSAKENMRKFIGRPLVVTSSQWHGESVYGAKYDHPYVPTNDLNKIFEHQEQFRVGNIVDVGEKDGDYFAMIEMLPKFANMSLPPFCSPAIYQLDAKEAEGQISKWEALHLAALDENPAYGARIALLKGTCVGTNNECRIQFRGAKQKESSIVCPNKIANLKSKLAIVRSPDKPKVDREMKHTRVDSNGPLINKVPFGDEDRDTKTQYVDRVMRDSSYDVEGKVRPPKPKNRDRRRIIAAKLKLKLASLGEQNMTYQNSKKIKIHKKKHPEVRKAASESVEDILRKAGRSVDASHTQSSFLSQAGDFIGSEEPHSTQLSNIDKILSGDIEERSGPIHDFLIKNKLIRTQNFPINRAGERKTSVDIRGPINKNQLKSIQELEKGGRSVGFAVGTKNDDFTVGEGSRDLTKVLRERKLL
jgi:hypothetical protein